MTKPHRCSVAEPIQALGPQIPCPVIFPGDTPLPGLPSLTLWVLHDFTQKKEIFRSLLSKAFPELLGVRLCAECFMRYTDYKSHKTSRERQHYGRGSEERVHSWEPRKDSKGQGSQSPLWRLDVRADKSTEATEMQLHFYCEFSLCRGSSLFSVSWYNVPFKVQRLYLRGSLMGPWSAQICS